MSLHRFEPEKRTALLSRIQHFKRLEFPEGVNVGRGYRAAYGVPQLMQLLVAFEMLELGVTPARIVRLLRVHTEILVMAAGLGSARLNYDLFDSRSFKGVYIHFDPAALEFEGDETLSDDRMLMQWGLLEQTSSAAFSGGRRLAIINASQMINMTSQHLLAAGISDREDFRQQLLEWAATFDWDFASLDEILGKQVNGHDPQA